MFKSTAKLLVPVSVLCLASCTSTLPPDTSRTDGGHDCARGFHGPGLEHTAHVAPGVYRGGQPTPEGFHTLRRLGIRTVINLREEFSESEAVEAAGLRAVEIPMRADLFGSRSPSPEQITTFLDVVRDPASQPVFFHCRHGRDRTGTMAAIYRMEVDGWRNEDALQEMRLFDFSEFYKSLLHCVRDYRPTSASSGAAAGGG